MDKNSMLYWYPKIKDLGIPQPKTIIVDLEADHWSIIATIEGNPKAVEAKMPEIKLAMAEIGLPLFLRTSHTSGKHDWLKTCYVTDVSKVKDHICELIRDTERKEIPIDAFVFREYIEMDSKFTAFSAGMPVNPERRYFIRDGEIQCHHAYWIAGAIAESLGKLPDNWLELLADLNTETDEEVELLSKYAQQVADLMDGYWSVDFCKAKDGQWWSIDMATGERSWHDESCEYYKEFEGI